MKLSAPLTHPTQFVTNKSAHCAHLCGWPRDRPKCISGRANHHILVGEALVLLHGAEVQFIAPGALVVVNVVQDLNPSEPALDCCTEAGLQTGIAASAAGARRDRQQEMYTVHGGPWTGQQHGLCACLSSGAYMKGAVLCCRQQALLQY
jgi:hypothetical protein